ncbi:MAG: aminoacyl-tRNA hydrolase [Alphaproteobacteria bacterium]|nr:aminoacyl-tRNA hydrolase [Alphaproteobacteria bacterium]
MFLIIGLGNPGKGYAHNRHNVGFMAVDAIADSYGFSGWSARFGGHIAEGNIGGKKTFLFKPMSYMNLSGNPAGELCRFYKIPTENVLAIHDELDLPLAKLRVKRGGGHGGHNGLKSLDEHLGKDYQRIRFGIGHPGDKDMVSNYVLADFAKAEEPTVEACIKEIATHINLLLQGDDAGFMNKLSLAMKE